MKPRLYALMHTAEPAPGDRKLIGVMILIATLITALAVQRVRARHQIIALGYQLSRATEEVKVEREQRRRLELERATLTSPERIRALATGLGMIPVPPDRIRVISGPGQVARGAGASAGAAP
jgi:cell division protein FtsL